MMASTNETNALSIIRYHLTCLRCNQLFNDPHVLPCNHSFCKRCIDQELMTWDTKCIKCGVPYTLKAITNDRFTSSVLDGWAQVEESFARVLAGEPGLSTVRHQSQALASNRHATLIPSGPAKPMIPLVAVPHRSRKSYLQMKADWGLALRRQLDAIHIQPSLNSPQGMSPPSLPPPFPLFLLNASTSPTASSLTTSAPSLALATKSNTTSASPPMNIPTIASKSSSSLGKAAKSTSLSSTTRATLSRSVPKNVPKSVPKSVHAKVFPPSTPSSICPTAASKLQGLGVGMLQGAPQWAYADSEQLTRLLQASRYQWDINMAAAFPTHSPLAVQGHALALIVQHNNTMVKTEADAVSNALVVPTPVTPPLGATKLKRGSSASATLALSLSQSSRQSSKQPVDMRHPSTFTSLSTATHQPKSARPSASNQTLSSSDQSSHDASTPLPDLGLALMPTFISLDTVTTGSTFLQKLRGTVTSVHYTFKKASPICRLFYGWCRDSLSSEASADVSEALMAEVLEGTPGQPLRLDTRRYVPLDAITEATTCLVTLSAARPTCVFAFKATSPIRTLLQTWCRQSAKREVRQSSEKKMEGEA